MNEQISTYVWPGQTHFGFGAAKLAGQEAQGFRAKSVFLLCDPGILSAGLLDPVTDSLEACGITYHVYEKIPPNPDIASVDAATASFRANQSDLIIAVGGGSVLDAAKGVRLAAGGPATASIGNYAPVLGEGSLPAPSRHEMPAMIAIPTTAGTGAEVTPWGVITDLERKLKFGIGGPFLLPDVALVDPELTMTLPPMLTAATGMDALSHCIEAYVSTRQNPALDPMILRGIELIGCSLRLAVTQPANRSARRDMMLASMIAGIAISSRWLGACHSLAHQLSSFANLHHGVAISLMLPHQVAFSLPGALDRYGDIAAGLDGPGEREMIGAVQNREEKASRAVTALIELIDDIGLPNRLSDVGVTADMIRPMAHNAYAFDGNWPTNPQPIDESDFVNLYQQAF